MKAPKNKSSKKKEKHSKKHKKEKRSKHDSSSSDDDQTTLEQILKREKLAVNTLRDILYDHPEVRKDLRQVLWHIDNRQAADISSIPNLQLVTKLEGLFKLLQLRQTKTGTWQQGPDPVLPLLGPVFDEPVRQRPPPAAQPKVDHLAPPQHDDPHTGGIAAPTAAATAQPHVEVDHTCNQAKCDAANVNSQSGDATEASSGSGPADVEPQAVHSEAVHSEVVHSEAVHSEAMHAEAVHPEVAQARRYGPAVPSAELLAAAQAAAAHYSALQEEEDEDSGDPFVGPAPPDMVEDLDAVPQDRREAEVVRILRVLRRVVEGKAPDAYDVLGVDDAAPAADIKKQYWKMSLLIHPDKCTHPAANEAFQAVAVAAKQLQDAGGRSAVDAQRKEGALWRLAQEEAAQQLRAHEWKVARGEVDPNAPPPGPAGPPRRDTWMTELPTERASNVHDIMSQKSVKAFSMLAPKAAQDSSWTMSPLDRDKHAAQLLLESNVRRIAGPAGPMDRPAAAMDPAMMAVYDKQQEKKSLLEQHQKKEAKKKRKGEAEPEDWEGKHPWRPFDREKDLLGSQPSTKYVKGLLKDAEALGSRFSGAQTGDRKFL